MACRGVHFAIVQAEAERLISAPNDDHRLSIIQDEIEARWEEEWSYETDKAWDATHRCLTDGQLSSKNGEYPLGLCILGGKALYSDDDYIISLVTPEQAGDVGRALAIITVEELREKYQKIDQESYPRELDEADFGYTWDYFSGLPDFFQRASSCSRFVVFTVDQYSAPRPVSGLNDSSR